MHYRYVTFMIHASYLFRCWLIFLTLFISSKLTFSKIIVVLKRQNRLIVGADKPELKVKMQSVSDDVRKRCYIFCHGVSGLRARKLGKHGTDGWLLDRWHQDDGACRTKRPSAGKTAYTGTSGPRYGGALLWRSLNVSSDMRHNIKVICFINIIIIMS